MGIMEDVLRPRTGWMLVNNETYVTLIEVSGSPTDQISRHMADIQMDPGFRFGTMLTTIGRMFPEIETDQIQWIGFTKSTMHQVGG